MCVFITLVKKTFKSSSFSNISSFNYGFFLNPSKVENHFLNELCVSFNQIFSHLLYLLRIETADLQNIIAPSETGTRTDIYQKQIWKIKYKRQAFLYVFVLIYFLSVLLIRVFTAVTNL